MGDEPTNANESADTRQATGYFVEMPIASNSQSLDLGMIWRQSVADRKWLGAIIGVVLVVSVLFAFLATPMYRGEILLAPAATDNLQGQFAGLVGQYAPGSVLAGLDNASNDKDKSIAILKSRQFTEEFIVSENLMPVLFSDRWDADNNEWLVSGPDDIPSIAKAYSLFDQSIRTVQEDSRRNLVTLRIDWTDPALAADWANQLIERLNDHLRQRDIAEAMRSIDFLNEELQKSSVIELRQGIYRLIESQIELVMLANVREEYAFKILDPAVAAEQDDFVRPKRLMIVLVGFMLALLLAFFVALVRASRSKLHS